VVAVSRAGARARRRRGGAADLGGDGERFLVAGTTVLHSRQQFPTTTQFFDFEVTVPQVEKVAEHVASDDQVVLCLNQCAAIFLR
jgi:hypothetical protein